MREAPAPGTGVRPGTESTGVAIQASLKEIGTASYALHTSDSNVLEWRRGEIECGAGGDHDLPYLFALPSSWPQLCAWIKLLAKVQSGELEP